MNSSPRSSASIASAHRFPFAAVVLALLLLGGSRVPAAETLIVGQPRLADDHASIRALENESSRAVMARDYATLERIWSEHFVVNAPNNRVFPNRAAVFEIFRQSTVDLYSSYEKTIECIAFDADLALVMGVETVTRVGAKQSAQRRYTNVWRFAHGAWRLIARQATLLPSDAAVIEARKVE